MFDGIQSGQSDFLLTNLQLLEQKRHNPIRVGLGWRESECEREKDDDDDD